MLHVLLFAWKYRINGQGLVPIYCRITLRGLRYQFSTGYKVKKSEWDSKRQCIKGSGELSSLNNAKLAQIKQEFILKFHHLPIKEASTISPQDLFNACRGKKKTETLIALIDEFLSEKSKIVGKGISVSTYQKYKNSKSEVLRTLKHIGKKDLHLSRLRSSFADNMYSSALQHGYNINTITNRIKVLKQIVKFAIDKGYIENDPLGNVKLLHGKPTIIYLNDEELKRLERLDNLSLCLSKVRDCFLFSCYTGLAYNEAKAFRYDHLEKDSDGKSWISVQRKKTGKGYTIPLLPKAELILKKYAPEKKLPLISNQKANKYLKDLAKLAKIKKNCTYHMSRKTYATTILLNQGVPMEIVSKLLGHSSIGITASTYAAVSRTHIKKYMEGLY